MDIADTFYTEMPEEELRARFTRLMTALGLTENGLSYQLQRLGDHRKPSSILKSIQRMSAGETGISGEIMVILRLLARHHEKKKEFQPGFVWERLPDGSHQTHSHGFAITLVPKSRGRWLVNLCQQETGYCPPWRCWQDSLDEAKQQAKDILFEELDAEEDRRYEEAITAYLTGSACR